MSLVFIAGQKAIFCASVVCVRVLCSSLRNVGEREKELTGPSLLSTVSCQMKDKGLFPTRGRCLVLGSDSFQEHKDQRLLHPPARPGLCRVPSSRRRFAGRKWALAHGTDVEGDVSGELAGAQRIKSFVIRLERFK